VTTLTRKCQYALRAVYFLAGEFGNGPIPIPRISVHSNAPSKFLETILLQLKNAGIVESRGGQKGGYCLRVPPDQINVGSIIRAIDGPLVSFTCVDEMGIHSCRDCERGQPCQIRIFMDAVRVALATILDNTFLSAGYSQTEVSGFPADLQGIAQ
jgi:Rrf2 family protein